jgi:RNA polymerase sigma-70 factor (ECF subfamily)
MPIPPSPIAPQFPETTSPKPEVDDILGRAIAGEPVAIASVLRTVESPMGTVIRRILGSSVDAEDAKQQALLAFIHALPSYRGEGNVLAFARTIALRTALASRRRVRTIDQREGAVLPIETLRSQAASPTEDAVAARRRTLLRELLDEIPHAQAEAIAMRIMLECTLEDIAAATGAPVNTVRSRIRLAKEALRRKIEERPEAFEALGLEA